MEHINQKLHEIETELIAFFNVSVLILDSEDWRETKEFQVATNNGTPQDIVFLRRVGYGAVNFFRFIVFVANDEERNMSSVIYF